MTLCYHMMTLRRCFPEKSKRCDTGLVPFARMATNLLSTAMDTFQQYLEVSATRLKTKVRMKFIGVVSRPPDIDSAVQAYRPWRDQSALKDRNALLLNLIAIARAP
jgi:hypothetical protein